MNIEKLVIADLHHRIEQGAELDVEVPLLDAYDAALDTAILLRRVIAEMTIGDGSLDRPERPGSAEEPLVRRSGDFDPSRPPGLYFVRKDRRE